MARHVSFVLTAALLCVPAGLVAAQTTPSTAAQHGEARPQDGPPRWKWWLNPDDRRELGISNDQSAQIDQIFESTMPAQRDKWREFERLEDELTKTIAAGTTDIATVTQKVTQVERLRAELNTTRTVMLYRMRKVLTPEQQPKFDALLKRRAEARRKQSDKDKSEHR